MLAAGGASSRPAVPRSAVPGPPARSHLAPTPKKPSRPLLARRRNRASSYPKSSARNARRPVRNWRSFTEIERKWNASSRGPRSGRTLEKCDGERTEEVGQGYVAGKGPLAAVEHVVEPAVGERQRRSGPVAAEADDEAGADGHDVAAPDVGHGVGRLGTAGRERLIGGAGTEALLPSAAQVQGPLGQQQLGETGVGPLRPDVGRPGLLGFDQQRLA